MPILSVKKKEVRYHVENNISYILKYRCEPMTISEKINSSSGSQS